MIKLVGFIALLVSTCAQAATVPIVRIWEVPNNNGGTYTISIDSTQSPDNWEIYAWGITNGAATGLTVDRPDWSGDLISSSQWDSGVTYSTEGPFGGLFPTFTTGTDGIGTFLNVFGSTIPQAAVFWGSYYTAQNIGPNNTSSQFGWLDAPPSSTAFALISGGTGGPQTLSCQVGSSLETANACTVQVPSVPIPAAFWLFGSALLGLVTVTRRKAQT